MRKSLLLILVLISISASTHTAQVSYVVQSLYSMPFVTSIVWDPDGRMFFTDKFGTVHMVNTGGLQNEPVVQVDVRSLNEDGLLSIALDPNFAENHYFYIYYTEADQDLEDPDNDLRNLLVRYTEQDGLGIEPLIMLEFPVEDSKVYQHNGGRIRFGADGYMYLSIGDLNHFNAFGQDINKLESKMHRFAIVEDRLVPAPGNPYEANSVWAYGLRNVFAFTFDPFSGQIFGTENGPDCDDEINLIVPEGNYGWGTIELISAEAYVGYCENPDRHGDAREPLVSWTPTIAPTGIMIYDGDAFPQWQGQLFFCSFKQLAMSRVELDETRTAFQGEIIPVPTAPLPNCGIEVAQGPDGYIYYSNTVGVYRLVPSS